MMYNLVFLNPLTNKEHKLLAELKPSDTYIKSLEYAMECKFIRCEVDV